MDFRIPFPFWPSPGPSDPRPRNERWETPDGQPIPDLRDYLNDLFAPPSDATPSEPLAPPSTDLPPLPQVPLTPISLPPPTPEAAALSAFPAHLVPVQALIRRRRPTGAAGSLERSFSQAYGVPLDMKRARKMARDKRTMRAQEIETQIPRNRMPVPTDRAMTPQEMQDAINREGRNRAEELRRMRAEEEALRRRPAQTIPNAAPPDTPRGRGGRLTPIFDPFRIAEDIGATIGEVAGEVVGEDRYGQTADEIAAAAAREKELAERLAREGEPLPGEIDGEVRFEIPQKLDRYGYKIFRPGEMQQVQPYPVWGPPQPTPQPKKSRMQRVLNRVQQMTNNPYALAGIFGLNVLGARRRSRSASQFVTPVAPVVDVDDLPLSGLTAGAVPFAGSGYNFSGGLPPSSTASCDCRPKKRGPKRRCLERAQVAWRTGRYKGKLAGTRCVRWE